MRYRNLGRTGVKVSPLCLGAMMFGQRGNSDHADCVRIIHRALDAGINFVDTANVYSHGESEEIVGEALRGRRDAVVLATKVHGEMGPGPNDSGNSRVHIMREVENSLRRLGTEYIDLYQIHRPDPQTPIDETLRALDDLVHSGKVRYIGSSTMPALGALSMPSGSPRGADCNGSGANSPRTRSSTVASKLRCCQWRSATGWAPLVWSPLAQGLAHRPHPQRAADRPAPRGDSLEHLSDERGSTRSKSWLRWPMTPGLRCGTWRLHSPSRIPL